MKDKREEARKRREALLHRNENSFGRFIRKYKVLVIVLAVLLILCAAIIFLLTRSKPEPDIYLMTCEKLGVNPGQAYAIEDSYNGIRSSYSAGMKPIMVPDMLPATEEMLQKSIVVLDDLLLVKDYLEEIHRRGSFT